MHNKGNTMKIRHTVIIGFLMMLMLIALPAAALAAMNVGAVTKVRGIAHIFREGTPPISIEVGMQVEQGDRIRTAEDASVRLEMIDGSILNLGEKADMSLEQYEFKSDPGVRRASLQMGLGKVLVFTKNIKKLQTNQFQVKTPNAVVGVRGTLFVVWVVNDIITKISCFEDLVAVYNVFKPEEVLNLGPNDSTEVIRDNPPSKPIIMTPEQLRQLQQDLGQQEQGGADNPVGGPLVDPPTGPNETPASGVLGNSSSQSDSGGSIIRAPGILDTGSSTPQVPGVTPPPSGNTPFPDPPGLPPEE